MHLSSASFLSARLEGSLGHPSQGVIAELLRDEISLPWFLFDCRDLSAWELFLHSLALLLEPIVVLVLIYDYKPPLVRHEVSNISRCRRLRSL